MERLCGVESMPVVYHRFSDGVEIVRCVLEFCKALAEVERSYSSSIHRLLQSTAYTFRSNLLMQWLGNEPYEEIGTLKLCWQKLGVELSKLADLHAEKADAYLDAVRKPLFDLLPQLEETRKTLKSKMQQLRITLEAAQRRHTRERQRYLQLGEQMERLHGRASELTQNTPVMSRVKKLGVRVSLLQDEFTTQENVPSHRPAFDGVQSASYQRLDGGNEDYNEYEEAHTALVEAHETFDKELAELYKNTEDRELERVNTLKETLHEFTKTLSNTAPAYLESMQKIVISVDEVNGHNDIQNFVEGYKELLTPPAPPELEKYKIKEPAILPYQDGDARQRGGTSSESTEENGTDTRTNPTTHHHWTATRDINVHLKQMTKPVPAVRYPIPAVRNRLGNPTASVVNPAFKNNGARPENGVVSEGNTLRPKPRNERLNTLPRSRDLAPPSHTANAVKTWDPPPPAGNSDNREKGERRPTVKRPVPAPRSLSLPSLPNSMGKFTVKPKQPPKPFGGSAVKVDVCDRVETVVNQDRGSLKAGLRDGTTSNPSLANENEVQPNVRLQMPPVPTRRRKNLLDRKEGDLQEGLAIVTEEDGRTLSKERTQVHFKRNENKVVDPHPDLVQLLSQLQESAAKNDYYSLFGVDPTATTADLAKARREKSRELHPDHFGGDHEQRARAEEKLVRINQVFQDVMKSEESRVLYNQMCHFRQVYPHILAQGRVGLATAEGKLLALQRAVKKAQMPLALLEELQLALKLIRTQLKIHYC